MTESEVAKLLEAKLSGTTRPRRPEQRLIFAADWNEADVTLLDRGEAVQFFRITVEEVDPSR
jgi:mRNA-degrading endonuclease RelE of RelBE toxin-antitoxin system